MENNFEQHIRDAANNPPEFPFEERLWNDMESRLDNNEKKPLLGFIGKIPLLLLMLVASSFAGFFYVKQYKAMERIAEIEQQLQRQQIPVNEDSIEKRVTVIYDTLYKNVVVNQTQYSSNKNYRPASKRAYSNKRSLFNSNNFLSIFHQKLSPVIPFSHSNIAKEYDWIKGKDLAGESISQNVQAEEVDLTLIGFETPFSSLPMLEHSLLSIGDNVNLPALDVKKRRKRKSLAFYIRRAKPTRFSLSGTTGTFASLNLGGNGFNLIGTAKAELGIGDRFSIVAGAEYFSNDFNKGIGIQNIDPLEGFPEITPNNDDDQLTGIQGDFNYLQIPFGIKQIVFPRRYLSPYIGLGLIAGKTTRSRLEYDYISASNGQYSVSRGNLQTNVFELNGLWSTLGVQIQMNRNWSLVLEGSSQLDLKKGIYKYENLQLLKLNTGVLYEF